MTSIAHDTSAGIALDQVLAEGYGAGAWHGPDLKAALAEVTAAAAFRRPAPGRHNIAEIALHHAYCARSVRGQLTGAPLEPFVLQGEDWFPADSEKTIGWDRVRQTVEAEQQRLAEAVAAIEAGRAQSPIAATERAKLVLGITCHAIYHAGQIQLVKKLIEGK